MIDNNSFNKLYNRLNNFYKNIHQIFFIFFIIMFLLLSFYNNSIYADNLNCYFLDVGQGDATLIELPNDKTMLIDGAKNNKANFLIDYIKKKDISKIDYLIATHPHADHIGGLAEVIKSFSIGKIYMPEVIHTTKTYENFLLTIKDKDKRIKRAQAGEIILNEDQLNIKIFSPQHKNYSNLNNWSIVIKINYGKTSFLFTGDIEKEVEKELVDSNYNINSTLLKVSHHGSSTSSSFDFLEKVSPEYSIISVGANNRYGHPDSTVINLLHEIGSKVYRTDKQGTILAISDSRKIKIDKENLINKNKNNNKKLSIELVDLEKELVVIKNNTDENINLNDWLLLSVKGKQEFDFSQNTIIKAGEILKIRSGRSATKEENTLVWTKAYIWNNDGDKAELYNEKDELIDSY